MAWQEQGVALVLLDNSLVSMQAHMMAHKTFHMALGVVEEQEQ